MTANAGLRVIAVDPAYTSRWSAEHWLAPLREREPMMTGHHAAAVVIGRRAHGHKGAATGRRDRKRPADRRPESCPRAPHAGHANRNDGTPKARRQPPRQRNTAPASRDHPPDQATEDRSQPPAESVLTTAQ